MKRIATIAPVTVAALIAFPAAQAATVTSLTVTGGSFTVFTNQPPRSGTNYAFPGGDLIAGAVNPILTFNLVDPLNAANSGQAWGYTTAASAATVDEALGTIQLAIPTFRWDWHTGPSPSLCTVKSCTQPQEPQAPGGVATGTWNPTTNAFSVSWTYPWVAGQHPFPQQVTSWSLQGIAMTPPSEPIPEPIPEPAAYGLLAAGLAALASLMRLRERRV